MRYEHAKHAGNFGDVIKHFLHVNLLKSFQTQNKSMVYLESHSGSGIFKLSGTKNAQHHEGIGKLWQSSHQKNNAMPSCFNSYLKQVANLNHQPNNLNEPFKQLKFYPGSPYFAQTLLSKNSAFILFELQDSVFDSLQKNFAYDPRVRCLHECGFNGVLEQNIDQDQTIYLLIDPPYEEETEYQRAITTLIGFYQKHPKATIALWYPVVNRDHIRQLEQQLMASNIKSCDLFEIDTNPTTENAMTGAGLLVVNAPKALFAESQNGLPYLKDLLSNELAFNNKIQNNGVSRCLRLIDLD